jgi:hypothetical protein
VKLDGAAVAIGQETAAAPMTLEQESDGGCMSLTVMVNEHG